MVEPTPVAAPDLTVRAAGFADLPALRHLYRQFLAERPGTSYPAMDGDELDALVRTLAVQFTSQQPVFVVLGAWSGDRPVGFLGLEIGERAVGRPHRVVNAHWLYVVPDSRGLGIARRLTAVGLEWLAAHHPDITHAEWFAAAGDPQWSQRGFVPFLTRYAVPLQAFHAVLNAPPVVRTAEVTRLDPETGVETPLPPPTVETFPARVNGSATNGKPPKHGRRKQSRRPHAPRRSDAERR